jgi:TrpR-related protein YerC/YecD
MTEYHSKLESKEMNELFEAILSLKDLEECYRFFEDICTINELKAIAQRLEVAKMLNERRKYIEIADKTGASTATISRVNRCLVYGADGYNMILKRLEEKK